MTVAKKAAEKTSYEVRRKWDKEHLTTVSYSLPKELVAEFRKICKERGFSQLSIVRESIKKFIDEQSLEKEK